MIQSLQLVYVNAAHTRPGATHGPLVTLLAGAGVWLLALTLSALLVGGLRRLEAR